MTVKYNVVPLKIGEFPIEIFVVSRRGNDAIVKILKVLASIIHLCGLLYVLSTKGVYRISFIIGR